MLLEVYHIFFVNDKETNYGIYIIKLSFSFH